MTEDTRPKMSGICDKCGMQSMQIETCMICGARVCSHCFSQYTNTCVSCIGGKRVVGRA